MTTARERYEQKTKVVTFRVPNETYDQIEDAKAKTGLSNADLIKLGAAIAQEEIKAKLAQASGLESRLAQLKAAVQQTEQELDKVVAEEKKRRLGELDIEMEVFKLFDCGWSLEEVSFKMAIPQPKAFDYFQAWAQERKDREAAERELLRACLKVHLERLKDRRLCYAFRPLGPDSYKDELRELEKQIDCCRHLLNNPTDIDDESKQFLLAEYSAGLTKASQSPGR
jgi:vacuolar-type H+-ATPase subunit I/STV1